MRKLALIFIALGVILGLSGLATAGDTATVSVTATVVGTCKFNAGAKTVSFSLDPATGGNVSGTVSQPQFWCTNGASYTISDDDGLYESGTTHRVKHALLTDYIPYSFTYAASGTGTGKNTPITMNIVSTINEADYLDASAGNYSDTVTLTITP